MSDEAKKVEEDEGEVIETKSGVKLTMAQWAEIVSLYELGQADAETLAAKFGIGIFALRKRFVRKGIKRGSRVGEISKVVDETIKKSHGETVKTFANKRDELIEATREEHYTWSRYVGRELMLKLSDAKKAGVAPATCMADVKVLRIAAATLNDIQRQRYAVLGVTDNDGEDELDELPILDLTQKEIEDLRQRQNANDEIGLDLEDVATDDIIEEEE